MRVGHPFVRGSYSFLAKKEYGSLEHHHTGSQNEARPPRETCRSAGRKTDRALPRAPQRRQALSRAALCRGLRSPKGPAHSRADDDHATTVGLPFRVGKGHPPNLKGHLPSSMEEPLSGERTGVTADGGTHDAASRDSSYSSATTLSLSRPFSYLLFSAGLRPGERLQTYGAELDLRTSPSWPLASASTRPSASSSTSPSRGSGKG